MACIFMHPVAGHMPPTVTSAFFEDMALGPFLVRYFEKPESYLTTDINAISERNAVIADLLRDRPLQNALRELMQRLNELEATLHTVTVDPAQMLGSLSILPALRASVILTAKAARDSDCGDWAKNNLAAVLEETLAECFPPSFEESMDKYASGIENLGSLTYRIDFDEDLLMHSVSLHSVSSERYFGPPMPLMSYSEKRPFIANDMVGFMQNMVIREYGRPQGLERLPKNTAKLMRLKRLADAMLKGQAGAVRSQLFDRCRRVQRFMRPFIEELRFLLGAVDFCNQMAEIKLPTCFAEPRSVEERAFSASGMYHPWLAFRRKGAVTTGDLDMRGRGDIVLLGGVNRGGKTTFLRSIGAVQTLFQMGMPIPAETAVLSPATALQCAFTRQEDTELYQGKLGQELTSLREALTGLDEFGFFLFNEPISGTSPLEGFHLSREMLCVLMVRQARGIWVTHLYKLFDQLPLMNARIPGSSLVPMRTANSQEKPFAIDYGVPNSHSDAQAVLNSTR